MEFEGIYRFCFFTCELGEHSLDHSIVACQACAPHVRDVCSPPFCTSREVSSSVVITFHDMSRCTVVLLETLIYSLDHTRHARRRVRRDPFGISNCHAGNSRSLCEAVAVWCRTFTHVAATHGVPCARMRISPPFAKPPRRSVGRCTTLLKGRPPHK